MPSDQNTSIQRCLDLLGAGDPGAMAELLAVSHKRLSHLIRFMLRDYSKLRRWEQTEDIFQNLSMRLTEALRAVPAPTRVDYFRVAAREIRRELIDLSRHYFGRDGLGRNYVTPIRVPDDCLPEQVAESESQIKGLPVPWTELHEWMEALPDDMRAVFDLLWYHGMTQDEAALCLGASPRTVKRRWQEARILLAEWLDCPIVPEI